MNALSTNLHLVHQQIAHELLISDAPLCEWAASFLQVVRHQSSDLTPTQNYWLGRLERETEQREAAHG